MMNRNKRIALARHLGCSLSELSENPYDENMLDYGRQEWKVLTDSEADEAVREYINDSVWAFSASFLSRYIPGSIKAIEVVQEKCCEDCNDLLKAAIGDKLSAFIDDAIGEDGRGNFLSGYDSEEVEINLPVGRNRRQYFYAYRNN